METKLGGLTQEPKEKSYANFLLPEYAKKLCTNFCVQNFVNIFLSTFFCVQIFMQISLQLVSPLEASLPS